MHSGQARLIWSSSLRFASSPSPWPSPTTGRGELTRGSISLRGAAPARPATVSAGAYRGANSGSQPVLRRAKSRPDQVESMAQIL